MKHTFALFLLGFAMLLAACNNTPKPAEPVKSTDPVEANQPVVDWEMPLYELNAVGDTNWVWTYQDTEEGRTVVKLAEEDESYYDRYEYQYDHEGRLIKMSVGNNYGKVRIREVTYTYNLDEKMRVGEGKESAEGDPVFFVVREESYFLDDACQYDTLSCAYSAEVSWDALDTDDDGVPDKEPNPVWDFYSYQRTKYEQTADGWRPVEKWYYAGQDENGEMLLNAKDEYAYDEEGRLASEITTYRGENVEEKTYTYHDNVRIQHFGDYQMPTYFEIKDKR